MLPVHTRKESGMAETVIGVIGGSGVYGIDGLADARWERVATPWGDPSDEILTGRLDGVRMAFLPRHGRGHVLAPSTVPYRANIDALKRLGVTDVVSISACGSFREEMAPGHFVIVDQFIDRTVAREASFFGPGLRGARERGAPDLPAPRRRGRCGGVGRRHPPAPRRDLSVHGGAAVLDLAESRLYREQWGCDVIGMTNMPEAKLAREAELCYASVAMVTDYDSWHPDHGEVEIADIIRTMTANSGKGKAMVARLPALLGAARAPCPHGCDRALDGAILTAPEKRDPAMVARLGAVAGRVL
jgi:5'-methylthioadenosine phosphorylase